MRIFKGINKNIVVLSVTSFFADVSSEMLYPIIPIFLTSVLGVPVSVLGLIEGVAESTASVMKAGGWNGLSLGASYNKAWEACKKAIFAANALFEQTKGVCGRTDLTLKPDAKL